MNNITWYDIFPMLPIAEFTIGVGLVFTGTYNPEVDLYFGSQLVTVVCGKVTKIGRYTIVGNHAMSKCGARADVYVGDNDVTFRSSGSFQLSYSLQTVNGYTHCHKIHKTKCGRANRLISLEYSVDGVLCNSSRYTQRNRSLPEKGSDREHWDNGHISIAKHNTGYICYHEQNSSHSSNVYSSYLNGILMMFRYAPVPKKAYYVQEDTQHDQLFYMLNDIVLVVDKTMAGTAVHFEKIRDQINSSTPYCTRKKFVEVPMAGSEPGIFTWTGKHTCMIMIHGMMFSFMLRKDNPGYTLQPL